MVDFGLESLPTYITNLSIDNTCIPYPRRSLLFRKSSVIYRAAESRYESHLGYAEMYSAEN